MKRRKITVELDEEDYGAVLALADRHFSDQIKARGYPILSVAVYVFVRIIGWRHYKK